MKNHSFFHLTAFIILLMMLAGCSVYSDVYSNSDRDADFRNYKTFAWLPDKDTTNEAFNNQIIRNNTRNYFAHCLGELGMTVNTDTPDVLLELVVKSEKKEMTQHTGRHPYGGGWSYYQNPFYYPFPGPYYYRHNYGYGYSCSYTDRNVEYAAGTITLNVIDRKQNKLVWTGAAKGDLYDPELLSENLHPAVYSILKKYPVQAAATKESRRTHKREVKELK